MPHTAEQMNQTPNVHASERASISPEHAKCTVSAIANISKTGSRLRSLSPARCIFVAMASNYGSQTLGSRLSTRRACKIKFFCTEHQLQA